ncbi:MAG: DUF6390 family protein [Patescibacteria group bacterium]
MFTFKDAVKYSIVPHELGFCGPDQDCTRIFQDYIDNRPVDEGRIRELMEQFKGVHHYCEMIARANDIEDPLDERVLEAYWIGNDLLEKARMENGKYPHHSYHVWQAEPFNPEIKLDDRMKEVCQVVVKEDGGKYFTYHWNKKIQEISEEEKNKLEYYNNINKNGK